MEKIIKSVSDTLGSDNPIFKVFKNCYLNTINTTVQKLPDNTTFVITGDIPAMWLRDSACQLKPYLVAAVHNHEIRDTIAGLISRQIQYILYDPYANAFNKEPNGKGWTSDKTEMSPWVWERKYEIDSPCYPIALAYEFWKKTQSTQIFTDNFLKAIKKIIEIWEIEQFHETRSSYSFERFDESHTDTLSRGGKGALVKEGIGLLWSGFRPSDDACTYGYLIPSNMFAVVILNYIAEIVRTVYNNPKLENTAITMSKKIQNAIETYGLITHPEFGTVYAYEVDGFGQYTIIDDANVPSLLSIPYIGYLPETNQIYRNTRNLILSEANPYFYCGTHAQGIGSPHTPTRHIWAISLAMEGLTSSDIQKKQNILELLVKTDGGTGFMHESFHVDNPQKYTREWFSWANSIYCELVLDYCKSIQ